MTTFALVGTGFRAAAYWRLAARLDGITCVGAVPRTPRDLPVPVFASLADCLATARPDFVVTSLPADVNPRIVAEAARAGVPVLTETPPGVDPDEPWADRVQVAEQYLMMPTHAARRTAVRSGLIGSPTQVQVSSTQLYHAVSLIRGMLGAGIGPVTVRATRHVAPLADPLNRAGWTDDPAPKPATTTIAMLDLGGGRSGLYDFTTNQTRNLLRDRRLLVRGTHGELQDDQVVRPPGGRLRMVRSAGNEHITLGDRVLYRNPYAALRLNDDEIALATLLHATAGWVRNAGPPPYPLAEGVHDHAVGKAIEEAAETGRTVTIQGRPTGRSTSTSTSS